MGYILPSYSDRVRYTLIHSDWGSKVISEPRGWKEDNIEFKRNETYQGVVANLSNELEFIGDGADFINNVMGIYGINAKIECLREEKHPDTDDWTATYRGFIDLTTYSLQDRIVTVKFSSSGLEETIKNRQDKKLEIETDEDMDGNPIEPYPYGVQTIMSGRDIFLLSILENPDQERLKFRQFNGWQDSVFPIMDAIRNSDQEYLQSVGNGRDQHLDLSPFVTNFDYHPMPIQMFYFQNDRTKVLKLKYHIKFQYSSNSPLPPMDILVKFTKWEYNPQSDKMDRLYSSGGIDLGTFPESQGYGETEVEISGEVDITVNEGESIALEIVLPRMPDANTGFYLRYFTPEIFKLTVEQESEYPSTSTQTVLAHELCARLLKQMTGNDDNFHSKALGRTDIGYEKNGEHSGAFTGFTHGMWLRNFSKQDDEENEEDDNRYKPFATTFKDIVGFFKAVWGLSLGIERDVFRERILIEPLSYFYNLNTTIRLGRVANVKRSVAKDHYYSGAKIGYKKPEGDRLYEEAMGLDEYNVLSTFGTIIKVVDNEFERVSKIRTDSYGSEFARRKPKKYYPTDDTNYDTDLFALDLYHYGVIEDLNDYWLMRKWDTEDEQGNPDFDQPPRGVFSPETAQNLRFSPKNVLLRNTQYIYGLDKHPNGKIKFLSSTGNTGLKTGKDGILNPENKGVFHEYMDKPRIIPEYIEFEYPVDFFVNQQLTGTTKIGDEEIRNFYGCVEFINEHGEVEYGFIDSVKPNGQGSWKLIKANR